MQLRRFGPLGLTLTVLLSTCGMALAAEPLQVKICPSREKAENIIQSQGQLMPDGCRTVTVTRVQSSAGPICSIDVGQDSTGILGSVRDAVTTTQWWTACGNLQAPGNAARTRSSSPATSGSHPR